MTTYESLTKFNDVGTIATGSGQTLAQTFTVGSTGAAEDFDLDSIKVKIFKVEPNPGTITAEIRNVDSTGKPVGSTLSSGTTDAAALSGAPGRWVTISMSSATLIKSTMYVITLKCSVAGHPGRWGWDGTTGNRYLGGNRWVQTVADGTWFIYGSDQLFEVIGTKSATQRSGITTRIEIDSVSVSDYQRLKVSRNSSDFNSSSSFVAVYDSPFGRHSTDFHVGNVVEVFADKLETPVTNIFKGIIEKVKFTGKGTTQTVTISGRDFSQRLQDATVTPVVYKDSEVSTIVKAIIADNVSDITTVGVDTTTTTLDTEFNHLSVFDALEKLAKLSGYYFYVDSNQDLHFEKRENTSSGIVLDSTVITKATLNKTREGMTNYVHVYGNRQLAGFQETFDAGSPLGGSSFSLLSKPRNTFVTVDGTPQNGGVFELTESLTSGPNYLVSYNDKFIVFVSGTDLGYSSIPASGTSVVVEYYRDIPLAKFGQDRDSIKIYGKKEKVITDKSINDPNTASDILRSELANSSPFKGFEAKISGWFNILPGTTARVTLSDFNIDEDIGILDVSYIFDKNTTSSENTITIKLDRKIKDLTDEIANIKRKLSSIESQDRQEGDFLTRLETTTNNLYAVGSHWEINTATITGSTLILSDSTITYNYTLASGTNQKPLAGNEIGSPYTEYAIIKSGGFY